MRPSPASLRGGTTASHHLATVASDDPTPVRRAQPVRESPAPRGPVFLPFPAPAVLLGEFLDGAGGAPDGRRPGQAPPAFGLVGIAGAVLFGSTAQVEKLLLIGPILVGAVGMYRLLRPLGASRARLAAAIAYLGLPLVWNGMAAGDLQALGWLSRAAVRRGTRLPAQRGWPGSRPRRTTRAGEDSWPRSHRFGLLLALMGALAPPSVIAVAVLALAFVAGSIVAGKAHEMLRAFGVTEARSGAGIRLLPALVCDIRPVRCEMEASSPAPSASPGTAGGVLRLFRFRGRPGRRWVARLGIPARCRLRPVRSPRRQAGLGHQKRVAALTTWLWRPRARLDGWARAAERPSCCWLPPHAVSQVPSASASPPSRSTSQEVVSDGDRTSAS